MKKQLLAALLITAFSGAALAQTVATVNGTKIDSTEVDAQVQMLSRESQGQVQDSPELRQSITKRLITRTLMIQEAKRLKIDQSPQYKAALDEAIADFAARERRFGQTSDQVQAQQPGSLRA